MERIVRYLAESVQLLSTCNFDLDYLETPRAAVDDFLEETDIGSNGTGYPRKDPVRKIRLPSLPEFLAISPIFIIIIKNYSYIIIYYF